MVAALPPDYGARRKRVRFLGAAKGWRGAMYSVNYTCPRCPSRREAPT